MWVTCYMLYRSPLDCIYLQLSMQADWVKNNHDPLLHFFIVSLPLFLTFLFKNNFLMVYIVYIT